MLSESTGLILVTAPVEIRQPPLKSVAGAVAFSIQKYFPPGLELALSRWRPCNRIFSRLRDGLVRREKRLIYFPIPKSACTLFATFMALSTEYCSDFDPTSEGVHGYRMRTGKLELNDFSLLSNTDFFRFTVLRDPHTRLVSAYLDKLVKPVQCGAIGAARSDVLNLSFEDIVEWVYRVPDWAIEKHFRPQITFIRNVPLDHIGLFEDLDNTFDLFRARFGVDIQAEVASKVRSPKRTGYADIEASHSGGYVGDKTVKELAKFEILPPASCFYDSRLEAKVSERFLEDIALIKDVRAKMASNVLRNKGEVKL
jgi:hypothetical protein